MRVQSLLVLVASAIALSHAGQIADGNGNGNEGGPGATDPPIVGSGEAMISRPSGVQRLEPGSKFQQRCMFTSPDLVKDEPVGFRKLPSSDLLSSEQISPGVGMFSIDSVTSDDAGTYECSVFVDGTFYRAMVELIIAEPTAPPATSTHKKTFDRFAYQRICKPGCKGHAGDMGLHGDDGEMGPQGPPGPAGPPGTTLKRPIKIQILKGDDGPRGRDGPPGAPGMHGMHGMPGFPGPAGPGGAKGAPGQMGYPGQQGPPGDSGPAGAEGMKGFAGRAGVPGLPGVQGEKGNQGTPGDQGPLGDPGADGLPGPDGLEGPPGDQGPEGRRGNTGERGSSGDQGIKGVRGAKGTTGETGFKGPKGGAGEDGDDGDIGVKGSAGAMGAKGDIGPEVYIHKRIDKLCNTETFGEVAYGPDMMMLYFCNGQTWECVESGGCKDCEDYVTQWSAWGDCSVTCGDGTQTRRRSLSQRPDFSLNECVLEETRECSTSVPCDHCIEDGKIFQLGESTYIVSPGNVAADVLLVVDESTSMDVEHAWLPGMVELLENRLMDVGIGSGNRPNMYSLTGFGAGSTLPDQCPTAKLDTNKQRFFTAGSYSGANAGLSTSKNGDREDGYHALIWALDTTPYRRGPGIGRNIILVTDEDRDNDCGAKFGITGATVANRLLDAGFKLNGVYNQQYYLTKGGQYRGKALGVYGGTDGSRLAFIPDGQGSYSNLTDVSFTSNSTQESYNRYTRGDYIDWTLNQGGVSWDLVALRDVSNIQQSFTEAFVDIKTGEIATQARACSKCTCQLVKGVAQSVCLPSSNNAECVCNAANRRWVNGRCL